SHQVPTSRDNRGLPGEKLCFWSTSRCLSVSAFLVLIATLRFDTSKVADLSPSSLGTCPCLRSFRKKGSEAVQTSAFGLTSSNRMFFPRSILGPFPRIGFPPFSLGTLGSRHIPVNPTVSVVSPDLASQIIKEPDVRALLGGQRKPRPDL